MPRGVAQDLIDRPIEGRCYCGKPFTKRAKNQLYCSKLCRHLAWILRRLLPDSNRPASLDSK